MVSSYFLKPKKIPIVANNTHSNFGSCCLNDFCAALECKTLSGRYGLPEKVLECLGNVQS